jgi:hypothetical protein
MISYVHAGRCGVGYELGANLLRLLAARRLRLQHRLKPSRIARAAHRRLIAA